jgi:D-3-phosphoglycerate dehydrogenase
LAKILVLYDKWMRANAEDMWRSAFREALGEKIGEHEFIYCNNVEGPIKWSSEKIKNVKEAYGNPDEIIKLIKGCTIAVSGYAPFTSDTMDASEDLKIIGISRGGPVNVDKKAATDRRIIVLRTVGRNAESVADQAMGFILSELRHIARHNKEIKTGEYFKKIKESSRSDYLDSFNWMEANGKTLGLIGYGQVGSRVARRAKAFDMRVIVFDPYIEDGILEADMCKLVDLDSLLRESDFVSVHAALSSETYHMIDAKALSKMKPTSVLINTARGSIIDEEALFHALKRGMIKSAALDVFEDDPLKPDNPLISLDNTTLTPHTAGRSPDTEMRGYRQIAKQVTRFLKNRSLQPIYIYNQEVMRG